MNFTTAKVLRNTAAIVLALAFAAGCNQQKNRNEKLGRGGHHGLRMACAADIQKYCADEPRKRRCLRDNVDKLSDACKAALAQPRGHKGGSRENGDND
ncbi:MAG TPA: hypothetical protein VGL35_04100 [Rhizomicrobium sp.]|jgi:hypothetical protein